MLILSKKNKTKQKDYVKSIFVFTKMMTQNFCLSHEWCVCYDPLEMAEFFFFDEICQKNNQNIHHGCRIKTIRSSNTRKKHQIFIQFNFSIMTILIHFIVILKNKFESR